MRDGIKRSILVMGITALVFLFCPRDFEREGLVREQMLWNRGGRAAVDFDEEVRLGRSAQTTLSNRVTMKIHLLEGAPQDIPSHWRGATLSMQNSQRWYAGPAQDYHELDERWRPASGKWQRTGKMHSRVKVEYLRPEVRRLFNPLGSIELEVDPQNKPELAVPQFDGTVRYSGFNFPSETRPLLNYQVSIKSPVQEPIRTPHPYQLEQYREQHPRMETPEAQTLLRQATSGLDSEAEQFELVERCRWYLATRLDYLLPGEQGAAQSLREFMSGEAGGHCEYFASALAVLLRMERIPCRMVTGYLAQEWNDDFSALIVRDKHAHAWLEVYDPISGWYTVDPSPAAADGADTEDDSSFGSFLAAMKGWWKQVTQFDEDSQGAFTIWLMNLPERIVDEFRLRPLRASGWLLVIVALFYVRRRLRPGLPAELRDYQRALRRAGLERRANETPRELLLRARCEEVHPDQLELLASATAEHETLRYRK
jgi:transglutaminase-like putative cysteine protease